MKISQNILKYTDNASKYSQMPHNTSNMYTKIPWRSIDEENSNLVTSNCPNSFNIVFIQINRT